MEVQVLSFALKASELTSGAFFLLCADQGSGTAAAPEGESSGSEGGASGRSTVRGPGVPGAGIVDGGASAELTQALERCLGQASDKGGSTKTLCPRSRVSGAAKRYP